MGCHNSKAAAAAPVRVPDAKRRDAGETERPEMAVEQEVAAAPTLAQEAPEEAAAAEAAVAAPELKTVPLEQEGASADDSSSQEIVEPQESAERLERVETEEDEDSLEMRAAAVIPGQEASQEQQQQQQQQATMVREVVSDGPVRPQAKTRTRQASREMIEPVALEAESAAAPPQESDGKNAEQRTTVVEVPEERPQPMAAQLSGWSASNGLQALGHHLELIQSTISEGLRGGNSTAAEKKEQEQHAEEEDEEDQLAPLTTPRPEQVPLPTLLGRTRPFGHSQSEPPMPQKMGHEDLRTCSLPLPSMAPRAPPLQGRFPARKVGREDCGDGMDEVFKSCLGHREKAPKKADVSK
eukprot:TRINITY_DN6219_c0_g1_i1.p1 TRINITY_DN6219_c0_g1~~TRINITY_DN6219_c0_g1_i1.p1  ORF type:complete len:354 (-),score=132.96 TRINITY_DN6219_c0_g1_i1:348-1409(-)